MQRIDSVKFGSTSTIYRKLVIGMTLSICAAFLSACSPVTQVDAQKEQMSFEKSRSIIGGVEVTADDPIAKHIVQVYNLDEGALWCTGSIIADNLIVTAAHCTVEDATKLAIGFGTLIPQNQEDVKKIIFRRVVGGIAHPDWKDLTPFKEKNWGDIAILKIEGKIPAGYKPAKLLASTYNLKNDQSVLLAGYGMTNMTPKEFASTLRKVEVNISDANYSNTEVKLDQRNDKGACHGDSGGPAYVKLGGSYALFGVTSRGDEDPGDTCRKFSVYTNLQDHTAFLRSAANELLDPNYKPQPIEQPPF